MRQRRTLIFTCNTTFGIVNFRGAVIRALVERGYRVVVVSPEDSYSSEVPKLGAEFINWRLSGPSTAVLDELRSLRQLVGIYREVRADLAFHFTIKAVIYGAIAARLSGTECISVITGLGYVFLNKNLTSIASRILYRLTLRWSREMWFLNEDDRRTFADARLIGRVPVRILPGEGVDTEHFAPCIGAKSSEPTFLMIARMLKEKGVKEFVDAARTVRRRLPASRFLLLGPGDADNPSAVLQSQIEEWQREGLVEYLGVERDVRPAIAAADCVVLPSYREGLPRVLLEAALMGKVLITTDVPGCRDVVQPEETGYLCKPRDPADLAAKMLTVAQMSHDSRSAMGTRGRAFVAKRYGQDLVTKHYLEACAKETAR